MLTGFEASDVRSVLIIAREQMKIMKKLWDSLSQKQRQWAWFVILWCGGLGSVMLLGLSSVSPWVLSEGLRP